MSGKRPPRMFILFIGISVLVKKPRVLWNFDLRIAE